MTNIKSVITFLENIAPRQLQESYDNAGLITGNPSDMVKGALIALDCTEEVVDEAIRKGANLIIAHHPIVFKGLKSFTGKNYVERAIIKAIKHDIAIYALHTNLDNVSQGVNRKLAEKLALVNLSILRPLRNLVKLVFFCPVTDTSSVLQAVHEAGAGQIGEYSGCSFKVTGQGRFTPSENSKPTIGEPNKSQEVSEDRIEVILPAYLEQKILNALNEVHPYEQVAYFLTKLENINQDNGAGMLGELQQPMSKNDFLLYVKTKLNLDVIRYSGDAKSIKKVAVCGGAGAFLLTDALSRNADAFITGDIKYHDFFDAENSLLYCDVGHYESEIGTKELLYDFLTENFTTFALHLTECVTNPIKYFK